MLKTGGKKSVQLRQYPDYYRKLEAVAASYAGKTRVVASAQSKMQAHSIQAIQGGGSRSIE